jgi:hypothetical protein
MSRGFRTLESNLEIQPQPLPQFRPVVILLLSGPAQKMASRSKSAWEALGMMPHGLPKI